MAKMQTATVETLVAEVRVLMVGSRQVTLSVAKQLDTVELNQIEPFGRVHLYGDGAYSGWYYVIGRHSTTGALVTATYQKKAPQWGTMNALPLIVLAGLK